METKEIIQLEYETTLTKDHSVPVQSESGSIKYANVGDITKIAVDEVIESVNILTSVSHDNNFSGDGTALRPLTLANLTTYENNTEAVAAIGVGRLYIRASHGLDITVTK